MSTWDDFHARHGRKHFTPAFNLYLEAQICDTNLETDSRVDAWLLRRAWGNWSDSCVDDEGNGIIQTQADCARDLGIARQSVNPYFQERAELGYIRFEGREIILVDDPRGCGEDGSSPSLRPVSDGTLTKSDPLTSLDTFVDEVLGPAHPLTQEYQQLREELKTLQRRHSEVRLKLMEKWRIYMEKWRIYKDASGGSLTARQEGDLQGVSWVPTNGAGILINETVNNKELASSSQNAICSPEALVEQSVTRSQLVAPFGNRVAAIRNAAGRFSTVEPEQRTAVLQQFEEDCRQLARRRENKPKNWGIVVKAMEDAIEEVQRRPCAAPPEDSEPPAPEPSIAEQIESLEALLATSPRHSQAAAWREQIESLKRKPAESERGSQAQKAGQR